MEEEMHQTMHTVNGQLITYALWGSGTLDPRQADAVLGTYVPEPESLGFVYRPDRIGRDFKGLRTAIDWFESPGFAGKGSTTPSGDLLESLRAARDNEGDKICLLALWPEIPTREDFAFVRTFEAEGVPVLDLSRTMDDLDLSLYTEPDPPKEPKTPKAPKTTKSRKISDPAPEATDIVTTVDTNGIVVTEAAKPRRVTETIKTDEEINLEEVMVASFGLEQARLIDDYINYKIRMAMVHRTEPTAGLLMTPPAPSMGDAYVASMSEPLSEQESPFELHYQTLGVNTAETIPFDGPYVDGSVTAYYADTEGNIRPAKGKPRRGETKIALGPLEIEVSKKEGRYRG